MSIEQQGAKPSGNVGKLIGKLMNQFHTGMYKKYFKNVEFHAEDTLLDIGCGGGKFLTTHTKAQILR